MAFLSALILLILGIILWIIAALKPDYYQSTVLTSIPIYSSSEDGYGEYIGVVPNGSQLVYSLSDIGDIFVELSYTEINNPKEPQTIYLIHNFFGYDINFSIVDRFNVSHFDFYTTRNMEVFEEQIDEFITNNTDIPETFRYQNQFQIKCPIPTLITNENHIARGCPELGGYQMRISDRMQILKIKDFVFHDPMPPINVVFHKLRVLPMNYIDTPQMYFTSWKKTNKNKILPAGIFFTFFSIITFILLVYILFSGTFP